MIHAETYYFPMFFASRIIDGTKRQTICAPRPRHVWPGEFMLFRVVGLADRTLVSPQVCTAIVPISIACSDLLNTWIASITLDDRILNSAQIENLARAEGFPDRTEMGRYWRKTKPDVLRFDGVLITWAPPSEAGSVTPHTNNPILRSAA